MQFGGTTIATQAPAGPAFWDRLVLALGTGFYLGFLFPRWATVGAGLGVPLALGVYFTVGWIGYIPVVLALCYAGVYICGRSAEMIGAKDPREVVYDEIATIPLVYFLLPITDWRVLAAGFFVHRVIDGIKPLGCYRLQFLPKGWGIMCDDVLAGVYAAILMHLFVDTGAMDRVWEWIWT